MSNQLPELPAAYQLICYGQITDLRTRACELAQAGAEEGTLLWGTSQNNARGRMNQKWQCNQGDLHCTIILRPDFSSELYPQIMLVGAFSMTNALATHLSAMTALGFGWPNDITIAKHKVAAIWIDSNINFSSDNVISDKQDAWLNVTTSVNIEHSPQDFSFPAMSIREAEGATELDSKLLLETYARQFITQINNWSEHGIGAMVKQLRNRADGLGQEKRIRLTNEQFTGILEEIGDSGEIIVRLANNTARTITLTDYLKTDYQKALHAGNEEPK